MNVQLSETWRSFIQAKVQSGLFASETEVVETSLRLLQERDRTSSNGAEAVSTHKPIWDVVEDLARAIPDEEFEKLPVDGAKQHDHYIHGTPKRPS